MAVLAISSLSCHSIPMGLDDTPEVSGRRGLPWASMPGRPGGPRVRFRGDACRAIPRPGNDTRSRGGLERAVIIIVVDIPRECRPRLDPARRARFSRRAPLSYSWPGRDRPEARDRGTRAGTSMRSARSARDPVGTPEAITHTNEDHVRHDGPGARRGLPYGGHLRRPVAGPRSRGPDRRAAHACPLGPPDPALAPPGPRLARAIPARYDLPGSSPDHPPLRRPARDR